MQNEPHLTLVGNLAEDPRTGTTGNGDQWTKIRLATNPRFFDRGQNEWRDGKTIYVDVMCFRRLAENAAACLHRGDPIVAYGKLRQRSWEDQQKMRHDVFELVADTVGVDLARRKVATLRPAAVENRAPAPGPANEEPSPWPQTSDGAGSSELAAADGEMAADAQREPAWS